MSQEPPEEERLESQATEKVEEKARPPFIEVKPKVDEDVIEPLVEEYMRIKGLGDRTEAIIRIGRALSNLMEGDEDIKDLRKAMEWISELPDDPILKEVKETLATKAAQKALSSQSSDMEDKIMKILDKLTPYMVAFGVVDRMTNMMANRNEGRITEERIREIVREVIREEVQPILARPQEETPPPDLIYEKALNFAKEILQLARGSGEQGNLEKRIIEAVANRIAEELSTPSKLSEEKVAEAVKKAVEEIQSRTSIPPEVWRDIKLKELELQKFKEEKSFEMEKIERQEKLEKEKMARLEKLLGPAIRAFLTKSLPDAQTIKEWLSHRQASAGMDYEFTCPYCKHWRIVKLTNEDWRRILTEGYKCPACGKIVSMKQYQTSSMPSTMASRQESQKSKGSKPSKKQSTQETTTSSSESSQQTEKSSQESSNSSTSGAGSPILTSYPDTLSRNTSSSG